MMTETNDDSITMPAGEAFFEAIDQKGKEPSKSGWIPPEPKDLNVELEDFDVHELIGRGGMGAVYRATQKSLDRKVALKVLPLELASDPEFLERFRREARAMAELKHPNVVDVYEFGETESGYAFIVMEFVDGMDFRQLIRSGHLDEAGSLKAVRQICEALEYAHQKGYVHRDIKPANIFLNREGQIKVGDFGLAKVMGEKLTEDVLKQYSLTMTGAVMGTPDYAAPEQMKTGEIDHRADIYSLGVLFYEMLTGQVPKGAFPVPSKQVGVDIRLDEVVLRAMQPDRELRYEKVSEVSADLEEIQTSAPSTAKEAESGSDWKKSSLPVRITTVLGVAWACMIALRIGLAFFFRPPHPVWAIGSILSQLTLLAFTLSACWLVWKWIGTRKSWRAGFALLAILPIVVVCSGLTNSYYRLRPSKEPEKKVYLHNVKAAEPRVTIEPQEFLKDEDGEALVVMTGSGPQKIVEFAEELERLRAEKRRLATEKNLLGLFDLTSSEILPKEDLEDVLTPQLVKETALDDQFDTEVSGIEFSKAPNEQALSLIVAETKSVKIKFPPGFYDLTDLYFRDLATKGYLTKIIFEGTGMDQTVVRIGEMSPGGGIHIVFRDLTIHADNDGLSDQRRGSLVVGMDRCRVVAFDCHSGNTLFDSNSGIGVYARDSIFVGGIDKGKGSGDAIYGMVQVAVFERCVFGNLEHDYFDDRPSLIRNAEMKLCFLDAVSKNTFFPEDSRDAPVEGWKLQDCSFLSPVEMEEKLNTQMVNQILSRLQGAETN